MNAKESGNWRGFADFGIVHIPKTAGKSVQLSFRKHYGYGLQHSGHRKLSEHRKRYETDNLFTIVRNPYDRIVSIYHHLQGHGKTGPAGFMRWLRGIRDRGDPVSFGPFISTEPQSSYLDGEIEYMAKFESLETDLQKIFGDPTFEMHRRANENYVRRGAIEDYFYDQDVCEYVEDRYAPDLDRFGHKRPF